MKTLLFSLVTLLGLTYSHAQGNLQFNQVLLLNSISAVPEGKVWKVESVLHGNTEWPWAPPTTDCIMSVKINAVDVCLSRQHILSFGTGNTSSAAASESTFNCTNFPFWLPAGSSIDLGYNAKFISVIEYNIVP